MLRTVSFSAAGQEQGIDQYIPPHLRQMFYKNPAGIHASHNGLDPYGFMTRGLVLYLPLWALKGSSFKSVDAYKHSCVATADLWTPNGAYFDGDEDIDLGDPTALNFGTGNFTIEVWTKIAATATKMIMVDKYIGVGWELYLNASDSKAMWFTRDATHTTNNSCASVSAIDDNVFHHVVGVRNGNDILLYVDVGTPVTNTPGDTNVTATVDCTLGATRIPGDWFIGYEGEVRIYNRALAAGELTHNRNCTIGRYQ